MASFEALQRVAGGGGSAGACLAMAKVRPLFSFCSSSAFVLLLPSNQHLRGGLGIGCTLGFPFPMAPGQECGLGQHGVCVPHNCAELGACYCMGLC